MTRKLTILLTALMLIMGIGVSWADNYTITFKTGSGDGSNVSTSTLCSAIVTEGSTYLSGNVATATKVYHSGSYGLKLGTSSDPGTLKMNLSSNGKVTPTSIVVRAKRYSSSKPTKLSLNGETAQDLTSDFADYTFNITNEITYLELKSSKGTSGGAYCWIASITVNYIATPSATLESIEVSGEAADLWTADEFSHEGITVMANWDEGDPTDVTSACEYSGYDMTSAGEQTVTVSYTAGEETKSDTYTVTVKTIGNTQDEPYTVAQAKTLIDAGDGLNEEVYVEGIICQVDSYNSTYSSITYWISTDGTTTDKFEVYSGLNAEDQNPFTSKDDLTVGYHAIVKGTIQKFNLTYEFSQNSRLVSYTPPVTQLPAPTNLAASNLSMSGATLSWNAVEHASSYTVYVTGINYEETFEPTTNSLVLDNLPAGTTYLWTVKAIGDGVTYLDSEESELAQFNTPTTVIYNINFEAQQTGGTIEFYPEQAAAGEHVLAEATADYHYSFTQWNFSPEVTILADGAPTDYIISFIMPDSDVTVSATFTEDTKYTVTYVKGDDDVTGEDPEPVSYYENDEVTLEENPYTRTGYTFYIWKVEDANDTQYLYENATFVMPASDVTVTPYWDEKDPATITLKDKGAQYGETIYGYVGDNLLATLAAAGVENPTGLDVMPDYEFAGWAQAKNTENPNIATTETTIAGDITLYAVYANTTPGETTWDLVTDASNLAVGDVVVIAASGFDYAMSTTQNTNNRGQFAITKTDSQVTWNNSETDGVQEITLETGNKDNTFAFNVGDGYLYAASSSSNNLKTQDDINGNASWAISISGNVASIVAQGTNTRNVMQYNQSSELFACYGSASQTSLALYKENVTPDIIIYDFEESAKIYTVTYDANGAEGEVPVEAMLFAQGDGYTLASAGGLTKEHHTFAGWKASTDEQTYAVGSTYTFGSASVTFTAQWTEDETYTVSYHVNGAVSTNDVYAGEMQLPVSVTAPNGYTFVGWTNQQIPGVAESATYFSSYNVIKDVDLYAVFAIAEGGGDAIYAKVTEEPDDWSGDYLLVYEGEDDAVAWTGADESNCYVEVTIANDEIAGTEGAAVLTIAPMDGGYSIQVNNGQYIGQDKYDNGITFSNNALLNNLSLNDNNAVITAKGANNQRPTMRYNKTSGQDRFRYYKSGQQSVQLYKYSAPSTTYSNFCTTVNELSGTITQSNITANTAYYISGNASISSAVEIAALGNTNASLLVIEDGGQLIHHNAGVAATIRKNITGYGEDNVQTRDGYYLIANPTANALGEEDEYDVLDGCTQFDLYTFDPTAVLEWVNIGSTSQRVTFERNVGYLFAVPSGRTMSFRGSLLPAGETEITLVRATEGAGIDFPGFNLIGNPYACNAYPTDEGGNFMSYYKMNEDGNELELVENIEAVTPCEGFFVEAAENNQKIYLTTETPVTVPSLLNITVSQNRGNVIDRAIVRFDGSSNLHKFMLNPAHTNLSIAKGGETFAAISTEAEGELPVNFKAEKNGTYTITVNTENVEANYLHLIDNLTGMDTDLLSTPSYTFDAKTSDYASRFKLVFGVKNDNEEMSQASSFAYINNGEIIVSNEGRATLQVIDVLGRIVSSEEINGEARISTNGMTAGLYILNLNGMTQKIVVR